MVSRKLMPVARGMISENCAVDKALNKASAESMISPIASRKGRFQRNFIHSWKLVRLFPCKRYLISAAPETLQSAYRRMYISVLAIELKNFVNNEYGTLAAGIQCSPQVFGYNAQ